jgi:hypothetical protein
MSLKDYLSILRNPFSLPTSVGKVPDGKVRLSLGERQQCNSCWSIGLGEGVFLLVPNYTVGYLRSANLPDLTKHVEIGVYPNRDHRLTLNDYDYEKDESAPDRWRLVSAGVKFSVVNNSVTNDGWFEAIRVRRVFSPTEYRTKVIGGQWVVYEEIVDQMLLNGSEWSNDPSYMRGKLTDIGKYMFYLQSVGSRDFKLLPTSWIDGSIYVAYGEYRFASDGLSPSLMTDSNFDRVAIRIHSTSCEGGVPTKLIAHTVHNFENVYDLGSVYEKHQTGSYNNPEIVLALDVSINSDAKPGRFCLN